MTEIALKEIEKENWKKAIGIRFKRGMTNSCLAPRDFSIECGEIQLKKITIVKGYWIWWCSVHHQPLYKCEVDKLKSFKEAVASLLKKQNEM